MIFKRLIFVFFSSKYEINFVIVIVVMMMMATLVAFCQSFGFFCCCCQIAKCAWIPASSSSSSSSSFYTDGNIFFIHAHILYTHTHTCWTCMIFLESVYTSVVCLCGRLIETSNWLFCACATENNVNDNNDKKNEQFS